MATAKAEVKKEEDLSLPEYFMRGAKKGFYITVELIAPAMVMAYTLITFLNLSGIMPLIGKLLAPVMGIFGLPGEASVVLLRSCRLCYGCRHVYERKSDRGRSNNPVSGMHYDGNADRAFCQNRFSMQSARSLLSGHVCNADH